MKPKDTTLQERMGFSDPDLSSPMHDRMVVWLMEHRASVGKKFLGAVKPYHYADEEESPGMAEALLAAALPYDPKPIVEVERPICSGKFVIGFIDVVISKREPLCRYKKSSNEIVIEWGQGPERMFIEVKPTIASFGEVMRQIKHYQSFENSIHTKYAIFSPDHRFKAHFEDQGIAVFSTADIELVDGEK